MRTHIKIGMLAVAVVFCALPMFAQSCPLCYTQAASSGARLIAGLRSGILVLIIPPMFMSVGITWLAYRKRNQFREDSSAQGGIQLQEKSVED
jgi:cbb3-type cytochrome oxidase subunit 3